MQTLLCAVTLLLAGLPMMIAPTAIDPPTGMLDNFASAPTAKSWLGFAVVFAADVVVFAAGAVVFAVGVVVVAVGLVVVFAAACFWVGPAAWLVVSAFELTSAVVVAVVLAAGFAPAATVSAATGEATTVAGAGSVGVSVAGSVGGGCTATDPVTGSADPHADSAAPPARAVAPRTTTWRRLACGVSAGADEVWCIDPPERAVVSRRRCRRR